ncbi:MAG: aminotransferase class I/II-fold pyridoxal phosphate-dependent enzyme [Flammeovirgaceae bacterium]|nr:aminotransferase class I/II-fold pyridoxal phosphate-dependent enzyme [Flammeovirgaceae bacterium]
MLVDLRSDTVTKPTPGMLEAMWAADVGDDVFGEDPSINELEKKCARLLGMDAGVYCPSGTMTNQIGLRILTQPYEEVICFKGSHIYKYEGGGMAGNSLVSARLLEGDRGRISVEEIQSAINPDDSHYPRSAVVSLENTVVREAGSYYTIDKISEISAFCTKNGLSLHLDGARLFNAIAETDDDPSQFGKYFDTISICLSKGLGAPVGSVLLCKKEFEAKARRMRKVFGGGMRQAGFIAAAGSYALDHHRKRLTEDHKRARALAETLQNMNWVTTIKPVDTNIVIFQLREGLLPESILSKLEEEHIKGLKFGNSEIRMVTHLDVDDAKLEKAISVIKKLKF